MGTKLKPIDQQVIVITGATSGIGLATAKLAASKGAKVVLAARNEEELQKVAREITDAGGEAISFALDVANKADVETLAVTAIGRFGRIDTWVNDAGIGIWGRLEDVSEEDSRRMFDTNFWGLVNGSLVAAKHLKTDGGAIVNLGSVASEVALALQSMYSATKHAILGFTDGLRQELAIEKSPISVTLIRPAAIGTPFGEKAKNYLKVEPQLPPPVYDVAEVAEGIVYAAAHRVRDVYIGGGAKMMTVMNRIVPGMVDWVATNLMVKSELTDEPAKPRNDNLHQSASEGRERGQNVAQKPMRSVYTRAVTHPARTISILTAAIGVGAAVAFAMAEQRAQSGFRGRLTDAAGEASGRARSAGREASHYTGRIGKKFQHWADEDVAPRFERYGKKYGKYASRWAKKNNLFG